MKYGLFTKIIVLSLAISCFRCSQTEKQNDSAKPVLHSFPIQKNDSSLVIGWDVPTGKPESADHYELLYRSIKDQGWNILRNNIPAIDSPKVTINRSELESDDSVFVFAVRSVAKNGLKSDLHFSSDSSASPPDWYVRWPKK